MPLGIIYKISNEDILRLKPSQWELSDDVLHMPIACVLVELSPFKIYVTHDWFWWLPISFIFLKIFLHYWRKDTWDNLLSSFYNN